jgi:deazaflavin-dependent oxidoreductase (nitroreductase family)
MSVKVTPPGTRGAKAMPLPKPLMQLLARPFTAMVKRPGSKMQVAGQPLLVLKTIGATSGKEREAVLGYWPDDAQGDGSILVIGSNLGAAVHPAWLFNIARNPEKVWIERAGVPQRVRAETLEGEERAAVWKSRIAPVSRYGAYEGQTDREIPIVRLRPIVEP